MLFWLNLLILEVSQGGIVVGECKKIEKIGWLWGFRPLFVSNAFHVFLQKNPVYSWLMSLDKCEIDRIGHRVLICISLIFQILKKLKK